MKYWISLFLLVVMIIWGALFAADKLTEGKKEFSILVSVNGEIIEMSAEEFALRVLLAEGLSCENLQAKKALAVAARSCGAYISLFGCKHDGFDVCDDGECCFNIGSQEDCDDEYFRHCVLAVEETRGVCLTYEDMPAMALFSLCHGSGSENNSDFPYLTAVAENETCDEHKKDLDLPISDFIKEVNCDEVQFKNNTLLVYGENKKCSFAIVGGKYIDGKSLAQMLGVTEKEIAMTFDDERVNIEVFGVGNGFGLSLCGSERMGESGTDFEKILENYYPQLTLNKIY